MATSNTFTSSMYEQDPRWTQVDEYTLEHLHPASRPNHAALANCLEYSKNNGLRDISAQPTVSKFLALQCRLAHVKHVLEMGTLGGYTAIWIASENPEIKVTSIEKDSGCANVARANVASAGLSERIEVIEGVGTEVLAGLLSQVEDGQLPRFGLTFIDADKLNNWNYFDLAVKMSIPGACIIVDNVVLKGQIVLEEPEEKEKVQGAKAVIEAVGRDTRVDAVVLQMVGEKNYDGILMAVVK
ncbi:hypothetical protein MMC30_002305 [Trapelia coarctata]|nr:hypothetical protein [Trapelia coarctata]